MLLRRIFTASLPLALYLLGVAACASAPPGVPPAEPASPGRICTEMGCVDGLTIELQSPAGWQPGAYRFEIELDQEKVTCEGSLPLRGCDQGASVQCTPAGGAERVQIAESGCALPPAEHSLPQIALPGGPARVKVTISRDGNAIGSQELSPAYRTVAPNGPECGPVCRQASAVITLR